MLDHFPPPNPISDVGITGNRIGMTEAQYRLAEVLLAYLHPIELHHGDCVGVDAQLHQLAKKLGIYITVHPPDISKHRAFCVGDRVEPPLPYLVRNEVIVRESEILLGFPDGPERIRSGTWQTIRFARKLSLPAIITYPDGHQEYH